MSAFDRQGDDGPKKKTKLLKNTSTRGNQTTLSKRREWRMFTIQTLSQWSKGRERERERFARDSKTGIVVVVVAHESSFLGDNMCSSMC